MLLGANIYIYQKGRTTRKHPIEYLPVWWIWSSQMNRWIAIKNPVERSPNMRSGDEPIFVSGYAINIFTVEKILIQDI